MDLETQTRNAQTYDFTDAQDDEADVFVEDIFVDRWDTSRAILGGDTYDAKEAIKFDWNTTHHKFDGDLKAWVVDADDDALDALEASLADAGFSFHAEHRVPEDPDDDFSDLILTAREGDQIEVVYQKKNGNGEAVKAGAVMSDPRGSRPDGYLDTIEEPADLVRLTKHTVAFETDQGYYRVHKDDSGRVSIYSSGYYPYMGAVESVTVTPADVADDVAPEVTAD